MAVKVPQLEINAARIDNLPGVKLQSYDTRAATESVARGLQTIANVTSGIGEQEREKADTAMLLDADRRLSEWETQTLYAPETGLLNRKGKDALGVPDEAMPAFDKLQSEIEGGLNDRARLRFRQMANGRRNDVSRTLSRHVSAQSDVIMQAEAEAYEATALQAIAANAGDNERVEMESQRLWLATSEAMNRMGLPAESIKAKRQELEGKVHGTVIDSYMARGDYKSAVDHFNANRAALGTKADEYGARVKQADLKLREADEVARIIGTVGSGPAGIREARKIEDPFLRDAVESSLDREAARGERLQNQYDRQVRENLFQKLETDGYDALTPSDLAVASGTPGLIPALQARGRQIAEGIEPVTDDSYYYKLMKESVDRPSDFANRQLDVEGRPKLDNAAFNRLVELQRSIKQAGSSAAQEKGVRTVLATVNQTLAGAGIDPSPDPVKKPEQAARVEKFWRQLDGAVEERRAQLGGKMPPPAEVKKLADDMLRPWKNTTAKDWWPDDEQTGLAFEAPTAPKAPDQRIPGHAYSTPKGAMTWTGTGWVPLKQPAE